MNEHLFKLKKDGKTVGYLKIKKGNIYWTLIPPIPSSPKTRTARMFLRGIELSELITQVTHNQEKKLDKKEL